MRPKLKSQTFKVSTTKLMTNLDQAKRQPLKGLKVELQKRTVPPIKAEPFFIFKLQIQVVTEQYNAYRFLSTKLNS